MDKDYYALLGIPSDASPEEIKSAYRRQAKKLHPDAHVGRDDCGGDRECFQDVHEAYETLSDPERRRDYDRQAARSAHAHSVPVRRRAEPLRSRPRTVHPMGTVAPEPWPERRSRRERRSGRGQRVAPEPLFSPSSPFAPEPLIGRDSWDTPENLFPPRHPQETLWERVASVGGDQVEQLYAEVPLTLDQAERGGRVDIRVPLQVTCPECRGWGGWGLGVCPRCAGGGRIPGERPLSLSFPGGIVDGQVARLSLERVGLPGVMMTVRFCVDEW